MTPVPDLRKALAALADAGEKVYHVLLYRDDHDTPAYGTFTEAEDEAMHEWEKATHAARALLAEAPQDAGLHTPGPWHVRVIRNDPEEPLTPDEMKRVLCESIDRTVAHGDADADLWVVLSSVDKDDPIFVCYTGNGPTSEKNARFIASLMKPSPDALREALDRAWYGALDTDILTAADLLKTGRQSKAVANRLIAYMHLLGKAFDAALRRWPKEETP